MKSYSDLKQDIFAVTMLNGMRGGKFLDIGCNHPIAGNNTYLLETEYGFSGIGIDWDTTSYNNTWSKDFQIHRPRTQHIQQDALNIDYSKLLGHRVDYLSIDIDPCIQSLTVLKMLPQTTRFSVITFEYELPNSMVQEDSRGYLHNLGYTMVINNVADCEDWYVDSTVVPYSIIEKYRSIKDTKQDPKELLSG